MFLCFFLSFRIRVTFASFCCFFAFIIVCFLSHLFFFLAFFHSRLASRVSYLYKRVYSSFSPFVGPSVGPSVHWSVTQKQSKIGKIGQNTNEVSSRRTKKVVPSSRMVQQMRPRVHIRLFLLFRHFDFFDLQKFITRKV